MSSSGLTPSLMQDGYTETIQPKMARYDDMGPVAVGERLELLRAALDVQNQTIAEMIGISPQKWRNYKSGENMIPPEIAIRLCTVTGADLDFIYRGTRDGISGHLRDKLMAAEGPQRPARRA